MGATWLYEHKQNHKKSSLKILVRFWNNLIEMFLEWPFSELFVKFWSVNKHGISEWRLLALYRHKEILVNSSLKATKKNWLEQSQKIRWAVQGHLGPLVFFFFFWFFFFFLRHEVVWFVNFVVKDFLFQTSLLGSFKTKSLWQAKW